MAWNIHEADQFAARENQVGKTEVDRHAPLLLVGQPIGINSGQRADQGGLPMIDMSGHGDDHDSKRTMRGDGTQGRCEALTLGDK